MRALSTDWLIGPETIEIPDPPSGGYRDANCKLKKQGIDAWRSGALDAGVAYRDFVHTLFESHMRGRAAHYASEARFRSSAFWRRARGLGPGQGRPSANQLQTARG